MATAWVKSLQCKSSAFDDVAYVPSSAGAAAKRRHIPKKPLLPSSAAACANSSQALRDVVFLFPKHPSLPKIPPEKPNPPKKRAKPKPAAVPPSPAAAPPAPAPFPTLAELPAGHSSRRVVEIIFGSSWSDRGRFPGRIEILFRVHNPPRALARFEDYRAAVRLRASADDSRCAADGNEMMRFHCPPPPADGIYDASCRVSPAAAGGGIRTFAGSGGAHDSSGGGPGRRAMLVCRVIAGRVRTGLGSTPAGSESVCDGKGELFVFDPRAVLPCFLIIYKI